MNSDKKRTPTPSYGKVWKLLSETGRWTRGAPARTMHNNNCDPHSRAATKWCASGAMVLVYGFNPESGDDAPPPSQVNFHLVIKRVDEAINLQNFHSIQEWNDKKGRTVKEVVELFKSLDL